MKKILLTIALVCVATKLHADSDNKPEIPRAISCSSGAYFMLVVPADERLTTWIWTVYSMGKTGAFKEAWSSDGIYGREIFLADDGIHVVCVESRPTGHDVKNNIVIAVYEEGRLLKTYRPSDLMSETSLIKHSVSHYRWLADWPLISSKVNSLYFTTIDGESHEVDMITGKLSRIYIE